MRCALAAPCVAVVSFVFASASLVSELESQIPSCANRAIVDYTVKTCGNKALWSCICSSNPIERDLKHWFKRECSNYKYRQTFKKIEQICALESSKKSARDFRLHEPANLPKPGHVHPIQAKSSQYPLPPLPRKLSAVRNIFPSRTHRPHFELAKRLFAGNGFDSGSLTVGLVITACGLAVLSLCWCFKGRVKRINVPMGPNIGASQTAAQTEASDGTTSNNTYELQPVWRSPEAREEEQQAAPDGEPGDELPAYTPAPPPPTYQR